LVIEVGPAYSESAIVEDAGGVNFPRISPGSMLSTSAISIRQMVEVLTRAEQLEEVLGPLFVVDR
jgi:hypothetical protein